MNKLLKPFDWIADKILRPTWELVYEILSEPMIWIFINTTCLVYIAIKVS